MLVLVLVLVLALALAAPLRHQKNEAKKNRSLFVKLNMVKRNYFSVLVGCGGVGGGWSWLW